MYITEVHQYSEAMSDGTHHSDRRKKCTAMHVTVVTASLKDTCLVHIVYSVICGT